MRLEDFYKLTAANQRAVIIGQVAQCRAEVMTLMALLAPTNDAQKLMTHHDGIVASEMNNHIERLLSEQGPDPSLQ